MNASITCMRSPISVVVMYLLIATGVSAQTIARPESSAITAAAASPVGQPAVTSAPGVSGGQGGSVAAPSTGPPDNRTPTTEDSFVRGRIIAADSGRPLRRATVRITGAAIRGARSATTDVDGRYEFAE